MDLLALKSPKNRTHTTLHSVKPLVARAHDHRQENIQVGPTVHQCFTEQDDYPNKCTCPLVESEWEHRTTAHCYYTHYVCLPRAAHLCEGDVNRWAV